MGVSEHIEFVRPVLEISGVTLTGLISFDVQVPSSSLDLSLVGAPFRFPTATSRWQAHEKLERVVDEPLHPGQCANHAV